MRDVKAQMDTYQIHKDMMSFVILRNGEIDWKGSIKLSWSGFAFDAKDSSHNKYQLLSSGILFWRKLTLIENGKEIDRIKVNKSVNFPVILKRGQDLYIDGEISFSVNQGKQDSQYGQLVMSWETDRAEYKNIIYTLMMACIQNSGNFYAGAVP